MNEKIVLEGKDTLDRLYEGVFSNKFHYFRCLLKMSSNFCSGRSLKGFVYMAIAPFVLKMFVSQQLQLDCFQGVLLCDPNPSNFNRQLVISY